MKKLHLFRKTALALFLSLSMSMTLCSAACYAEPEAEENVSSVSENPSEGSGESTPSEGEAATEGSGNSDPAAAEGEKQTVDENTSSGSSSDAEAAGEKGSEDAANADSETAAEEESDFDDTGIFGISVTDRNGVEVNSWYDSSSNIYYLFLTNAVSISELEMKVTGIKMEQTSKGTLDTKTNTVTGAFASGDSITLTDTNGEKYNVIVKQSGIPSLSISLSGTTLDTIDSGSKETKYAGQTVLLTDASGNVNVSQSDVEIKGRGNTTWNLSEKKPYQLKFSKKQSVLGMAKAKKWVLLANAFDDSMLRNKAAYYLGDSLGMNYSPDMEFVDLWVDGEYRGTYSIGEKCEIDSNRLNLTDSQGALMENDFYYMDEEYWYEDPTLGAYFSLSECVDDSQTASAIDNFKSKETAFVDYLFNTSPAEVTLDSLGNYIDVESFAKWYLVNEYMCNFESWNNSWFWYCDGASDVLHLGPIWDFDVSSLDGNLSSMYFRDDVKLTNRLMQSSEFASYVKQVYSEYRTAFSSLSGMVAVWGSQLSQAADCNYTRWQWLGRENGRGISCSFASSYAEAISNLQNWLTARDSGFAINVPAATISASVSESGRYMTVTASDIEGASSLSVAVWSKTNGQDDLKWYDLSKNSDGSMSVQIDLKKHGSSDTYYAHVYGGGAFLGGQTVEVTMDTAVPEITAEIQGSDPMIHVTVKNVDDFDSITIPVWSSENGQDDLKWTDVSVNKQNEVAVDIDPSFLKHDGTINIHVYGKNGSAMSFLGSTTCELSEQGDPEVTAVQTDGGNILEITVNNLSMWTDLSAAVWGDSNGQNDLKWYKLTKNADGTWTQVIDITDHGESGSYNVHIYGKKGGISAYCCKTTVEVTEPESPSVTVTTVEEGVQLEAVLTHASSLDRAVFAVWGSQDDQNDLKWYEAKKRSDGTWYADIPLSVHQETGTYYIHAYGTKNGKQTFQASATAEVDKLNCSYLNCRLSASGKTLVASLENSGEYTGVSFAVWGAENGQNDLKWYKASANLDGSWTAQIDLTAHNEKGMYYIHAYGAKNGSDGFICKSEAEVESFADVQVSAVDKGKYFQIKALNAEDYTEVVFAVWTLENGQDDLQWYTAGKFSDFSYRYKPGYALHGGNGTYYIHAYGKKGGKQSFIGSVILEKSDLEDTSEVSLNKDGTKLNITLNDTIGYTEIHAAVWGEKDGQNDLKWYDMEKDGSGVFTYKVPLSDHNETGTYNIHFYGLCGGRQYYVTKTTVTVEE